MVAMSKKIRSHKKPLRARRRGHRLFIGLGMCLCLSVGGLIWAGWRGHPFAASSPALSALPQAGPPPIISPPKKPAKEYIYVGGKLEAIEEPKPPAGGTAFDFTGNGSGDAVIFRPVEGNWYVLDLATNSSTLQQLGQQGDIIVPGDYDGDALTDIAIWHPKNGTQCNGCGWYVKRSSTNTIAYTADWGDNADLTVPADYDGDGKTEKAVWRPSEGNWYIIQSQTNTVRLDNWGQSGDKPAAADYDGDGKADLAVFRPADGNWYIKKSGGGTLAQGWGASGDWLAPADYDGDGKADITVWRSTEGNWYIRQSSNNTTRLVNWGASGDVPVPGDYDGDGRTDIAVWRSSDGNWYVKKSSNGTTLVKSWGQTGDLPVPAAYVRKST